LLSGWQGSCKEKSFCSSSSFHEHRGGQVLAGLSFNPLFANLVNFVSVSKLLLGFLASRELHIRVERRRDPMTGDYYENIGGMMFKDGFLIKTVSMKSISTQNIQPTFDELEKFRQPDERDGEIGSLSTLFANRKKGHFMKGDAVIVVKGDLKNLKGWVEKVEDGNVHIRPNEKGLPVHCFDF